jgi:hypothetical protein
MLVQLKTLQVLLTLLFRLQLRPAAERMPLMQPA